MGRTEGDVRVVPVGLVPKQLGPPPVRVVEVTPGINPAYDNQNPSPTPYWLEARWWAMCVALVGLALAGQYLAFNVLFESALGYWIAMAAMLPLYFVQVPNAVVVWRATRRVTRRSRGWSFVPSQPIAIPRPDLRDRPGSARRHVVEATDSGVTLHPTNRSAPPLVVPWSDVAEMQVSPKTTWWRAIRVALVLRDGRRIPVPDGILFALLRRWPIEVERPVVKPRVRASAKT